MPINKLAVGETPLYSRKLKYLLFILPALYAFLLSLFYYQTHYFFTTSPDPVYAYLANGTNLASGNFDIGHFDHPGTPVQLLVAAVVFITHLFTDRDPISLSVISHPEFYLGACAIVLICLLMLSVYASGKLILKHTGNITIALFFQLVPISCYISVSYLIRAMPEALIIICINYYYAFLWVLCYERNKFPDSSFSNRNFILFFSLISALLVTTKITCVPFLVIPLFFINKVSDKIRYVITSFVFAALILFPVWSKLGYMFGWFSGLATHSGIYGHGKEELFDKTTFLSNLLLLFTNELFFAIGYLLISMAAIAGWIMKKWGDNYFKLVIAFWIVCTAQLILAAKHFGYHYIIPSQLLIIPGVMAGYMALINLKPKRVLGYCVLLCCSAWLIFKSTQNATAYSKGNKVYETSLKVKKFDTIPKIITSGYLGSCFVEAGLRLGSCYGGDHYNLTNYFLRKAYPDTYFYDLYLDADHVKFWDISVYPIQLFEKNPQVLVYFINMVEADERKMIHHFTEGFDTAIKSVTIIDDNKATGERFYMINLDTSKTRLRYSEKEEMVFDFEKKSVDNSALVSTDNKYTIPETRQQSAEKYFSGNYSVKLLPEGYSCVEKFHVNPGDAFDISVNCYSSDRMAGISLSSPENMLNVVSEAIIEDYGNGWKKINLKSIIPAKFTEKEVTFCLYYYGHKTCYIDDLHISFSKGRINED